jgi:hypothetical protein
MGATRDAVGLIGSVLRSLKSLIVGDEAERSSEHNPLDWQTTEQKRVTKERLAKYYRRLAYVNRMTPTPVPPAPTGVDKSDDAA